MDSVRQSLRAVEWMHYILLHCTLSIQLILSCAFFGISVIIWVLLQQRKAWHCVNACQSLHSAGEFHGLVITYTTFLNVLYQLI